MTLSLELQGRVRELAADLYRQLQAQEGTASRLETKFSALEDESTEIGDALTCQLLEVALAEGAQSAASESARCGSCGREAHPQVGDEIEPRIVQTRRGEVGWCEPKYYCKHCRKDFFPSVASSGD